MRGEPGPGKLTLEKVREIRTRTGESTQLEVSREFGISRKTGYKIYDRYKECGLVGLTDRLRRPYRYGNQLPYCAREDV